MRPPRVIVLHSLPSQDPSVMVGIKGSAREGVNVAIPNADSPQLATLRTSSPTAIADEFDVHLIKPMDMPEVVPAATPPPISWGVKAVGADSDTMPFDGNGVTVAVLDTGIDRAHLAFTGIEIIEEDFTGEGNGDQNGHGTHCAGTICGRDVGRTRFGVARGVKKLLIGKVLGASGGGSTADIADAIQWALQQGAHVISMSLGMDFPGFQKKLSTGMPPELATSKALQGYRDNVRLFDRMASMIQSGDFIGRRAIIVAATGNESRRNLSSSFVIAKGPPAAADGFISVAALQQTENAEKPFKVASFSNSLADVAAPGVEIWSAKPGGGLQPLNGTSMATPHVAGIAALWVQKSMQDNDGEPVIGDVIDDLRSQAKLTAGLDRKDVGKGNVQAPK